MMEESFLGTLQNASDASVSVTIDKLHARLLFNLPQFTTKSDAGLLAVA